MGVELHPGLQADFDAAVEALEDSITAVADAEARVGRARSLNDEVMDEYDAHARIVRRFADASKEVSKGPCLPLRRGGPSSA